MTDKYITEKELRLPPYNISAEVVDKTYLGMLQDMTKDFIDRVCCQSFEQEGSEATPVEKILSGTNKDTIFLPRRLITLKKVKIYTDLEAYDEYEPNLFLPAVKYISWKSLYGEYNSRIIGLEQENFPRGTGNVGIVGVWGWPAIPTPIKYLQGKMIAKIITDDSFAERFSSENVGDYSASVASDRYPVTGDRELDMIIRQYSNWVVYAVA